MGYFKTQNQSLGTKIEVGTYFDRLTSQLPSPKYVYAKI